MKMAVQILTHQPSTLLLSTHREIAQLLVECILLYVDGGRSNSGEI